MHNFLLILDSKELNYLKKNMAFLSDYAWRGGVVPNGSGADGMGSN